MATAESANNNAQQIGVLFTERELAMGRENKVKEYKHSVAQLPAFRAASNLMYTTMQVVTTFPRKYTRFTELLCENINELMRCIAYANETRNPMARVDYLGDAIATCAIIRNQFVILARITFTDASNRERPLLGKDRLNKKKKEVDGVNAQLVGWRDFTVRECLSDVTT